MDMTMTATERGARHYSVQRERQRDRIQKGILALLVVIAALQASLWSVAW